MMTQIKKFLHYCSWPLLFAMFVAAYAVSQTLGYSPGLALLAITIIHFALIACLELLIPARADWSWLSDRQVFNDIFHGLMLDLGARLGGALLSVMLVVAAISSTSNVGMALWPQQLPFWIQLLLAVLIYDFFDYWKHRSYHAVGWLWPIHALHHNPERMHIFKAGRLHFAEAAIRILFSSAPLILLGAPQEVLFWIAALSNVVGNQNHWNVDARLPRWLDYLMATPPVHWEHHAIEYKQNSVNLSSFTMLFDHLFGTFQAPPRGAPSNVGIDPDPISKHILGQLLSPVWMNIRRE
jgi:ornithine lipid hydroxylase